MSSAIDKAVNNIDFRPLAGKDVYLDTQYLAGFPDEKYLVGTLRQHMLAQGCSLKATRDEAAYIVEARVGALGTNRRDVMLGIPALNVPNIGALAAAPAAIPEIPVAKTTDQEGIAKIAMFAYNRETLAPVWQSGAFPVASHAKDSWILGMGPFQRGTIYDGTRFAGSRLIFSKSPEPNLVQPKIPVTAEAVFEERPAVARAPEGDQQPANAAAVAGSAAADESAPPAGRVVRLPSVEQSSHSAAVGQATAQDDAGALAPGATPGDSDGDFELFSPRTWF